MNLGFKIEKIMKTKKVSQSELAKNLGVQRQTVFKHIQLWKKGKEPSLRTLKKWCYFLGVDYKKILNEL